MPASLSATALQLIRGSVRVAGPALSAAMSQQRRPRVARLGSSEIIPMGAPPVHPLLPAAVRVERSRRRSRDSSSDQVAITMWFRDAPGLPGPGAGERSELARVALRLGLGLARSGAALAGAAAIGAAGVAAARMEAARQPQRLRSAAKVRRLPPI